MWITSFLTESLDKLYDMIKNSQAKFPRRIKFSKDAKDIIQKLFETIQNKDLVIKMELKKLKNIHFLLKITLAMLLKKYRKISFYSSI